MSSLSCYQFMYVLVQLQCTSWLVQRYIVPLCMCELHIHVYKSTSFLLSLCESGSCSIYSTGLHRRKVYNTLSVLNIPRVTPPPSSNSCTVKDCFSPPPLGVYTNSTFPGPGTTMSVALYYTGSEQINKVDAKTPALNAAYTQWMHTMRYQCTILIDIGDGLGNVTWLQSLYYNTRLVAYQRIAF